MPISEVFNEDCMIGMARYPDKYFELAIVDPPYGIGFSQFNRTNTDGAGNRYKANKYKNGDWDSSIPNEDYFNELKRISVNQIIWGGNYYFNILGNSRGLICWYKEQAVDNFSNCEFAWNSIDCVAKVFHYRYYSNMEGKSSATTRIHPTQKPISLYKWLLHNYAKPGDKILDTHMGSQSSRIAAFNMGFDYWGWEIDREYFEVGNKRFKQLTAQQKMF